MPWVLPRVFVRVADGHGLFKLQWAKQLVPSALFSGCCTELFVSLLLQHAPFAILYACSKDAHNAANEEAAHHAVKVV